MKTIALKEKTFKIINEIKKKKNIHSFDKLITELVKENEGVKDSMFGELKGKTKSFTRKERENIWKDSERLK